MKKRPQLELDELKQLSWLLGAGVALIALSSLFYLDSGSWLLAAVGFVLIPLAVARPTWPAIVPIVLHRFALPVIIAWAAYDFYAHGEPLSSMVRLDALLLLYRATHYRRRREDLQLLVLGLFLVVMAGVITVSLIFAAQIILFVACGLLFLLIATAIDALEGQSRVFVPLVHNVAPAWTHRAWLTLFARLRESCDWRVFAFGSVLFAGFVTFSGLLFMTIPRFQLDSGLALDRFMQRKASTGFSDTLKFGDVTDIQQDDSVVLRVEASDRELVPPVLYWRMVVLDDYKAGTFQMSAALKSAAFQRELTLSRIESYEPSALARPAYWTFYLEPGVSRYLPLGGGFRRLTFTEPQAVRVSQSLRLVMLGREAASMKAYRVEGMGVGDRIQDGPLHEVLTAEGGTRRIWVRLNVSESDQAELGKMVAEITGGRKLSAEDFSRAAMTWIAKRHEYSLKSTLPPGANDPLVRWLASKEPGHCELFAGGFALLGRAAGFPTRMVAGYLGGAWNGDYLMVRNSDAHAWCEIFTGRGQWLRADPTNEGPRLVEAEKGSLLRTPQLRDVQRSWAARIDRIRLLWYRHIVNFDRAEQQQVFRTIKESTERTGREIRERVLGVIAQVREWLARPWSWSRGWRTAGWSLLALSVVVGCFMAVRRYVSRLRRKSRFVLDPVRREAGRWLTRLQSADASADAVVLREQLQRLRYGRKETWPDSRRVLKAAKCAARRGKNHRTA
ncbi:MAG: DUF3488 and transglutaminase-like domain-containing protein [Nibricoccus sp.]